MRKRAEVQRRISERLQFEAVRGIKRLQFILLEYLLFSEGEEEGSALRLDLPRLLSPLSLMLHIVESHALSLLRLPCYFARLGKDTVGLCAIQERHEGLHVASLGVAKEYRRQGIGVCILSFIEAHAIRRGKKWLEVDVLRKNMPAKRIYTKYGFTFVQSGRHRRLLRGRKPASIIAHSDGPSFKMYESGVPEVSPGRLYI